MDHARTILFDLLQPRAPYFSTMRECGVEFLKFCVQRRPDKSVEEAWHHVADDGIDTAFFRLLETPEMQREAIVFAQWKREESRWEDIRTVGKPPPGAP